MSEVMIPPWVKPESPETLLWIDDATQAFPPAFGRGTTQRGIWADPRWGLRRRYRGLRSDERAAILNALNERRGQFNVLRVTPHTPLRGSMPTGELLANNTFADGTTGWTAASSITLTAADRVLRASRNAFGATGLFAAQRSSNVTVAQYAPYVARYFFRVGRGSYPSGWSIFDSVSSGRISAVQTTAGMISGAVVPLGTTLNPGLLDEGGTGFLAGDYIEIYLASLSRGALVDGGPNLLVQSDAFNTTWAVTRATITANAAAGPDGTSAADSLNEDGTATSSHYVQQSGVTVSSAALDYAFGCFVRPVNRDWVGLQLEHAADTTQCYFNVTTGAVGSASAGTGWSNARGVIASAGNGWYWCSLVARKSGAQTSLTARIYAAEGDNDVTFSGGSQESLRLWRATLAQSAVPTRPVQTTTTSTTGTEQSGSGLYTKGWPASTNGLLLAGDWFEINGELKQMTAPVNSDAAGLAYMQFRPALAGSPADNDPIIIHEPFGRFIYPQGTAELENLFGIYGDCEMNLEEVYV